MSVRLRYLAHDLELPNGEFVIGRTPDCQLSLDDPLVSRKHALLMVRRDGVFITDFGSRNGVFVNGKRVLDATPLHDGDVVRVGDQQMSIQGLEPFRSSTPPPSARARTMRDLRPPTPPGDVAMRESLPDPAEMLAAARNVISLGDLDDGPSSDRDLDQVTDVTGPGGRSLIAASRPDRRVSALGVIGSLADKALALGNVEEAERILARPLADVRARAEEGDRVEAAVAERAASYAIRLAGATGKGSYIDYAFVVYAALAMVMPGKIVEDLYTAVRKVTHAERAALTRYTTVLRDIGTTLGPAERFLQQRIEGLERWIP